MHLAMRISGGGLDAFAARAAGLSRDSRGLMAAGLNSGGDAQRRATVTAETGQTGLKHGTIERAQQAAHASSASLAYTIRSHGGDVHLKFFGAKEGPAGVTASPWGAPHAYAGAFIKGGRFPKRVDLNMGGAVLKRVGSGRLPLRSVKSGLFIPVEMTKGHTAQTFQSGAAGVAAALTSRLAAALG